VVEPIYVAEKGSYAILKNDLKTGIQERKL